MEEKGEVKKSIIAGALELFSAKGYEGVSVNELTETAGISKPTLYYYFGSKEGLFDEVCKIYYSKLNKQITDSAFYIPKPENYDEDIILTLKKITSAYFTFARTNVAFFRISLANLTMPASSSVFKVAEKYHFEQFEIVEKMFLKMEKAHGNLKGKSSTLTWSFIGTINSYISLNFACPLKDSPARRSGYVELNDKTARDLVHQFMHGIFA